MAILRNKSPQRYTVVPNALLRDKDLDGECLGLLVYLLSHSDNFKVTIELIALDGRFGSKNKINRNLTRLRDLGYAQFQKFSSGHTQWDFTDTKGHFSEHPDTSRNNPNPQNRDEDPHPQKPDLQKPDQGFGDVLRKNKISELPTSQKYQVLDGDWLPQTAWDGFKEMRKAARKPMTKRAEELMLSKLKRWQEEGHDIEAILDQSTVNNWQDCYLPKEKTQGVATVTPIRQGSATKGNGEFRSIAELRQERNIAAALEFINE